MYNFYNFILLAGVTKRIGLYIKKHRPFAKPVPNTY